MAVLRADQLASFLSKDASAGLLVYGLEESKVGEIGRAAVKQIAGSIDDPFLVAQLEDSVLAGDPGRLVDEVLSQSLFGGRRAILVEGAGQGLLKALALLPPGGGNVWIAMAGNLAKDNDLRLRCEAAGDIGVVPCYEDTAEDVRRIVSAALKVHNLRIEEDALQVLVALLEGNRQATRSEAEKLALYCYGQESISAADVVAACSVTGEAAMDELVDAVFGGELAAMDRVFAALLSEGESPGRLALAAGNHAARLVEFHAESSHGKTLEQTVKSARPPVFYKRQPILIGQLRRWPAENAARAASSLHAAVLACREHGDMEAEIASRALMAACRSARAG